eukprot:SAG31_NODE_14772_length_788_cov_1.323657_1_plen_101_part_10
MKIFIHCRLFPLLQKRELLAFSLLREARQAKTPSRTSPLARLLSFPLFRCRGVSLLNCIVVSVDGSLSGILGSFDSKVSTVVQTGGRPQLFVITLANLWQQ